MIKRIVVKKDERIVKCPSCDKTINLDNVLGCDCVHIQRADNDPNIAVVTPHGGPYYELFNVWFQYPCWCEPVDC